MYVWVIVAREGLECHYYIEFEYYNNTKILTSGIFNSKLCAYCAGASGADGIIDEQSRLVWKTVLHVCQHYRASSALHIARTKRRNGVANEQRAQRPLLTTPTSQAPGDLYSTPSPATSTTTIPAATRVTRRRRCHHEPNSDILSHRALARPVVRHAASRVLIEALVHTLIATINKHNSNTLSLV